MYKYHPEIEGLKCNEDGTSIRLHGESLVVKKAKRTERATSIQYIYFAGKTYSVAKIVCECWNGMAENPRWCATRRDTLLGFHHSNLFWAPKGFNPAMGTPKVKRSKLSKLSAQDIEAIQVAYEKCTPIVEIAKQFNTSSTSIKRALNHG